MAFISRHLFRTEENKRKIMDSAARCRAPGKFLSLRNGKTHYQLDDPSDRPLLICIHGWSTASYVWKPLKPFLRDKGYRLLTYDLYGRGFSDRPEVHNTAELFTRQLSELLSRLELNNQTLNVVGYSMGGAIAARFVSERLEKVERLLLIAPAGFAVQPPITRYIARRFPRTLDPHVSVLLQKLLPRQFIKQAEGFDDDPKVACVLKNQLRELDYRGYIPSLVSSLHGVLASKMEAEHELIKRSDVAVRALFATEDKTIPYCRSKRLFDQWYSAGARHDIADAGHAVTYTHRKEIMDAADDFLERRD